LNLWHRQSAELHNRKETISRELAVLDERRRALLASQQALLSEQERAAGEETLARERRAEVEQESARLPGEHEEAKTQLAAAQSALQARQAERAAVEAKLSEAREQVNALNAQRAESLARLDELKLRIESQNQKLEAAKQTIQTAEAAFKKAETTLANARVLRERLEGQLNEAEQRVESSKQKTDNLEKELRAYRQQRDHRATEQARIQAQLEVIEQAEASLAGYAEGARLLLDASRQSRLATRGALSAALDVPAELETAISAALGDSLDAILLSSDSVEDALTLLEQGEGRAALLPLDIQKPVFFTTPEAERSGAEKTGFSVPDDPDCLGVAASLLNTNDELRTATQLLLGQTLIVRTREAARRILQKPGFLEKSGFSGVRVVTLAGEVFRADGLILAGKSPRSGTLGRPRQKRETQSALDDVTTRLASLDESIARLSADLDAARREQAGREGEVVSARGELEAARGAEQKLTLDAESARRQFEFTKSQVEALTGEVAGAESDRERVARQRSEMEASAGAAQESIRALTSEMAALSVDEVQEQVTYWNTRLAVSERSLEDLSNRRMERDAATVKLEAQKEDVTNRIAEAEQSLILVEADKGSLRSQEFELNARIEELN
ncbi:MAG: hypothetical protein AB1750_20025, partial [Chloroflexota bacterium]